MIFLSLHASGDEIACGARGLLLITPLGYEGGTSESYVEREKKLRGQFFWGRWANQFQE
jgi:hypothetical protein